MKQSMQIRNGKDQEQSSLQQHQKQTSSTAAAAVAVANDGGDCTSSQTEAVHVAGTTVDMPHRSLTTTTGRATAAVLMDEDDVRADIQQQLDDLWDAAEQQQQHICLHEHDDVHADELQGQIDDALQKQIDDALQQQIDDALDKEMNRALRQYNQEMQDMLLADEEQQWNNNTATAIVDLNLTNSLYATDDDDKDESLSIRSTLNRYLNMTSSSSDNR